MESMRKLTSTRYANDSKIKMKKKKRRKVRLHSLTHIHARSAEFRLWHFSSLLFAFRFLFSCKIQLFVAFLLSFTPKATIHCERACHRQSSCAPLRSFFGCGTLFLFLFFCWSIPLSRCDEKILCLLFGVRFVHLNTNNNNFVSLHALRTPKSGERRNESPTQHKQEKRKKNYFYFARAFATSQRFDCTVSLSIHTKLKSANWLRDSGNDGRNTEPTRKL